MIIPIIISIVSILIIIVVAFQNRGTASSMAFGGNGESYRTKKGLEKLLFYSTIILASIFVFIAVYALVSR